MIQSFFSVNFSSIKKRILAALESKNIDCISSERSLGKVLVIGDGISSVYADSISNQFDFIITVNMGIFNVAHPAGQGRAHIVMEPSLMYPGFLTNGRSCKLRLIRNKLSESKLKNIYVSSHGAFFAWMRGCYSDYNFISPHHLIESSDIGFNDFTGALQSALGLAIMMGYKNIYLLGFEAWTLSPKNNLRWFENVSNTVNYDVVCDFNSYAKSASSFLEKAAACADLFVYEYGHYRSNYKMIKSIKLESTGYTPSQDRKNFFNQSEYVNLIRCKRIEDYTKINSKA